MALLKVRDWKPGEITRSELIEWPIEDSPYVDVFAAIVASACHKFGDRLITIDVRLQVDCHLAVAAINLPPVAVEAER